MFAVLNVTLLRVLFVKIVDVKLMKSDKNKLLDILKSMNSFTARIDSEYKGQKTIAIYGSYLSSKTFIDCTNKSQEYVKNKLFQMCDYKTLNK